ncbi:MAG: hypothetical protein U0X87_07855 [Anaerolineales bacterium]
MEVIRWGSPQFSCWGEWITPYVDKASGAYLWDVDGKKYVLIIVWRSV